MTGLLASHRSARLALSCAVVLLLPALAPSAHGADRDMLLQLREAWVYFEAGNLRSSERGFRKALDLPGGGLRADSQKEKPVPIPPEENPVGFPRPHRHRNRKNPPQLR